MQNVSWVEFQVGMESLIVGMTFHNCDRLAAVYT